MDFICKNALAGNRTRVDNLGGYHSTSKLLVLGAHILSLPLKTYLFVFTKLEKDHSYWQISMPSLLILGYELYMKEAPDSLKGLSVEESPKVNWS